MFSAFERTVAFRYLRARRQEGFISLTAIISLIGIALGVATLIVVMSVMNGFRAELFERVLGLNGHIAVMAIDRGPLGDFDKLTGQVRSVDGVTSAHPSVEGQAMIVRDGNASGVLARGIRAEDLRSLAIITDNLRSGALDAFGDPSGVVLGDRLAARLGVG
ncbi:MAG: ABC transporter permease, partial [Alphaproteobacteria bacterium]|nr:ABC transporter permease [Alphaproteobacteria bacterium]